MCGCVHACMRGSVYTCGHVSNFKELKAGIDV